MKSNIDVMLVKIGAVYKRTEPTDIPFMLMDMLYRILNVPWQMIPSRMHESNVLLPMQNAFGPSKTRVISASRIKPNNNLGKLVYGDEEPCLFVFSLINTDLYHTDPIINL